MPGGRANSRVRWDRCWSSFFARRRCVVGVTTLFACEISINYFLEYVVAGFPGRFVVAGSLNYEVYYVFSFLSMLQQTVYQPVFAVNVLGRKIRGGSSVSMCLGLINRWRGAVMRFTVTRSTKGPRLVTACRANKSRTLYGPSDTCVSLDFSSPDGLETASDGSRKIRSPTFGLSWSLRRRISK